LLAERLEEHHDIGGWWISEKLDGVRAYWDGKQFLSRNGNAFLAPDWFVDGLPEHPLDGELWVGRRQFQHTISIVRRTDRSEHWKKVRYVLFDAPGMDAVFEERLEYLRTTFPEGEHPHAVHLEHERCDTVEAVMEKLAEVEELGGEGLMARKPGSKYVAGRSSTLLKIKTFQDDEARVVGHVPGAGRHEGRLGAVEAVLRDGTKFSVGTGFSDAERESPPPIGAVITVRYQELTPDGVPRFPTYVGVRIDHDWGEAAEDASPSPKKPASKKPASKKSKKRAGGEAAPSAAPSGGDTRYYEYVDDKSSKFWEITVSGKSHTVRYGRISTSGTSKTKTFATEAAARADADKLASSKVKKGYEAATPPT
jgi:DNA ligase-1